MYTLVIKEQTLPTVTMTLYRFAKICVVVEEEKSQMCKQIRGHGGRFCWHIGPKNTRGEVKMSKQIRGQSNM